MNTKKSIAGGEDEYEYVDLQSWWKTHKNDSSRGPDDMAPLQYETTPAWGYLTTAIIDARADERRALNNEMKFIMNG